MDVAVGAAEILVSEGEYEEALCLYQILVKDLTREYGPRNARTLKVRSRVASLLAEQARYTEALRTLVDVYRIKLRVSGIGHPCTLDTRRRIVDLLERHGTSEVTSAIFQRAKRVFRLLRKIINKKYLKGLYAESLKYGLDILEDMLVFLGDEDLVTLEMGSLIGKIYAATEEYDYALEMLDDVYQKKLELFGPHDRRTASSLMRKASVMHKLCYYEEAVKSYCEVYDIRADILGRDHKKALSTMRCLGKVSSDVGNYDRALAVLNSVADLQVQHNYRESLLTDMDTGMLQFDYGQYEEALETFRGASTVQKAAKRTRAIIQDKIGTVLAALGRYNEARLVLKRASRIMKSTNFHADTMSIYRDIAVTLVKEGMFKAPHAILKMLIEASELTLSAGHSVTLSMENDLGELYFSRSLFKEALKVFTKLWNFHSLTLGSFHPSTLNSKRQVAKVYAEQGRHDEALKMYNEIVPILKAIYYPQHRDYLMVQVEMATLYRSRGSHVKAFEIYYENYEKKAEVYGADHPCTLEVIEAMQAFNRHVPLKRLIGATLMENFDDVRAFVDDGDDVNGKDVNGAVPLHYASREGYVDILKYLLRKGAIYNVKDMLGNTPESFAADDATKFAFLLIERLFECVKKNELEQVRRIIRRENSIINARDAGRRTPLQWAVAAGHIDIVQELIARGADVALACDEDGTVLHMAAERGYGAILDTLLGHLRSGDIAVFRNLIDNKDNIMGTTPLHVAVKQNYLECVNVLASYRANPMIKEVFEKFPYDCTEDDEVKQRVLTYAFNFLSAST